MKRARLAAAGAVVLLLILAGFLFFFVVRVPSGGMGVIAAEAPGMSARTLEPGFHFVTPGAPIAVYHDLTAKASGEVMVTPMSGGEVPLRYDVSGRLDPARMGELHAVLRERPVAEYLSGGTAALLRSYAARSEALTLLTPEFRTRAAGEIAEALKRGGLIEASVTLGPPDDETLMAASQFAASRHEGARVRPTVAEALATPEGGRSWKLHTAMGYIHESEKGFSAAEKSYLDALAIEPAAIPPMAQLVTLYSAVQDWMRLQRVLDAAIAARPDSPQHLNWLAMVKTQLQDYDGAERMLKQGIEAQPDNHVMMANLGTLSMRRGKTAEAIEIFQRAVETAPESQQALFNLGSALATEGRFADALPFLERAAEAGSMTAPLARALSVALDKTGDTARAAGYRKQAETMEGTAGPGTKRPGA